MSKFKKATTGQHIITDATLHMRKTQYAISKEQTDLLKLIAGFQEDSTYADFTFDNLPEFVRKALKSEMVSAENLSKVVSTNKESGCVAHFGIRTNKLSETLEGTFEIATDRNILGILGENLPSGFDNSVGKSLPILGAEGSFWGASKPTFLTTLLETISFSVTGEISDSSASSIFHTFNCPKGFDSSDLEGSLFVNVGDTVKVTVPHSGYSYGGDRLNGKDLRPQDCTSFLEMSAQLTVGGASTPDLYLAKRVLSEQSLVVVDKSWLDSAGGSMVSLFDINTSTPKPGDVWAVRKFNESRAIDSSLGYSGHAGVYLDIDEGNVVTLAYNRDIPHIEGFGLEIREFEDNSETRDQFWLTRNSKGFNPTIDAYPFNDLSDLGGLVSYVDSHIAEKEEESKLSGELETTYGEEF